MMHRLKKHTISFKHAFDGICHAYRNQPNLRIHFLILFLVVIAGLRFELSALEWILILFVAMWVIVSEMINTALESVVDLVTREYREEAKIAKDVAAGTVLIGAIGSVIVGIVIFIPHIWGR